MSKYFVVATAKNQIKLKGNWYKVGETVPSELSEEEYKFAKDALNIESENVIDEKSFKLEDCGKPELLIRNNKFDLELTSIDEDKIKKSIVESIDIEEISKEIVQVGNKPIEHPVAVEKPKAINKPTTIKRPDTSKAKPRKAQN